MRREDILNQIRGGLIVSCQALEEEPLHSSYIMSRMAYAAMLGGAAGIRANSVQDIMEIKKTVKLPVIGIIKREIKGSEVYITPTMHEIEELVNCGTEIIAMDATNRARPDGVRLGDFFPAIREKYPDQLFMADCSSAEEGIDAEKLGFDIIGTTMSGYTSYTCNHSLPDYEMMRTLVDCLDCPIIAEGGIWTADDFVRARNTGVWSVVIGSSITRPLEITRHYLKAAEKSNSNLGFANSGRYQGDNDGPAYVVYSKTGYHKASMEFLLSRVKINMRRRSDQKWTNSYIFLGVDVYDEENDFLNCIDAGFCYSGKTQSWHLFYNLLKTNQKQSWYESDIILNPEHDYRLILDSSQKNGYASLRALDLNAGEAVADSAEFEILYAKKDGSNLSMYQDYAIDYPEDIRLDHTGKEETQDWEEVSLYNTNENLYVRNIIIENAILYNESGSVLWTEKYTNDRYMWPSTQCRKIKYPCTVIREQTRDSRLVLDLDLNDVNGEE